MGTQMFQSTITGASSSTSSNEAATVTVRYETDYSSGGGSASQWQITNELISRYYLGIMRSFLTNPEYNGAMYLPLNTQLKLSPTVEPLGGGERVL